MPVLIVKQGKQRAGWRLTESIDIGRLPQNDLALDAHGVSREHARIRMDGETCVIEDLGSTNGTWVNGTKLDEPHTLVAGDEITIGKIRLTFLEQDALPVGLTALKPRSKRKQIVFRCGECEAVLQAPLNLAGQKGKCAGCGTRFIVPLASGAVAQAIGKKQSADTEAKTSVGPADVYELSSDDSAIDLEAATPSPADVEGSSDDSSLDLEAVTSPDRDEAVRRTLPDDRPAPADDAAVNQDSIDFEDSDRIASAPDDAETAESEQPDVVPFAGAATVPHDDVDEFAADITDGAFASGDTVMGFDFDAMTDVDNEQARTEPRETPEPQQAASTHADDVTPGRDDDLLDATDDASTFTHDVVDNTAQFGSDQPQHDEEADSVPVMLDPERQPDVGDQHKQLGQDETRTGELERDTIDGTDAVEHVADAPPAINDVDVLPVGQHDAPEEELAAAPESRSGDEADYLAEAPVQRDHSECGSEADGGQVHESDWWQDAVVVLEGEDEQPRHDPVMATLERAASSRGSNVGLVARVQRHAAQRARQMQRTGGPAATARFMGLVSDNPAPNTHAITDAPVHGVEDSSANETQPAQPAPNAAAPTTQTITLSPGELGLPEKQNQSAGQQQWQRRAPSQSNQDANEAKRGEEMVDNSHLIDWLDPAPAAGGTATATATQDSDDLIDWMPDEDQAPAAPVDPGASTGVACSICGSGVCENDETVICPECETVYHEACWQENLGCASYGCKQVGALDSKQHRARTQQQQRRPQRKALPRRRHRARRRINDGTPWELVLLAAAFIAMIFGLVAFGAPSAVALTCTVLYKMFHRKRRFSHTMFATVVALNVFGLAAGAAVSWYLFIG